MEELKVTFDDKVSIVTKPVPLINKVTDDDMNQLKNKHNDTVDVLETIDGELTTAQEDILQLEQDVIDLDGRIDEKQDDLGITDETTHLLTPKEIREGAGAETKLITDAEAETKIDTKVPLPNTDQFNEDSDNRAQIKGLSRVQTGSDVTFKLPISEFGKMDDPISDFTITDLLGFTPFNVSFAWIKAETEPVILSSGLTMGGTVSVIKSGTFSTDPTKVNLVKFTILNPLTINAEIQVLDYSEPIDPLLFVWLDYNDTDKDLVADPTLINQSLYAADYVASIDNPSDAASIDLGSGNRALSTANHPTTAGSRAKHQVTVSVGGQEEWNPDGGISVTTRVKYGSFPTTTSLCSNANEADNFGFRFFTRSTANIGVKIGAVNYESGAGLLVADHYYDVGFSYNPSTGLKVYYRSASNSVTFTELTPSSGTWENIGVIMTSLIWMERNNSSSSTGLLEKETDCLKIYNKPLSAVEMEAEFDTLNI
jgi:hypothetical protein